MSAPSPLLQFQIVPGGRFPIYGPRGDAASHETSGRIISSLLVTAGIAVTLLILLGWLLRSNPSTTYRGTVTMRGETGVFTACGESTTLRITDAGRPVARIYHELAGEEGSPVFAEIRGVRRGDSLTVWQLRRMEPGIFGCAEDLSGVVFRAFGNEPFWRVDIGTRQIILARPGMLPVVFSNLRRSDAGGNHTYTAGGEASSLVLRLSEHPCRDSMAGSYYSYTAAAQVDGQDLEGCAKEGRP